MSIRELAELIQGIVGFTGELKFDTTKPDGTPRKSLDVFVPQIDGFVGVEAGFVAPRRARQVSVIFHEELIETPPDDSATAPLGRCQSSAKPKGVVFAAP